MVKKRRMSYMEVLKLAKKPTRKELWLFIKLTLMGVGILGALAFIIKLLFSYVFMGV